MSKQAPGEVYANNPQETSLDLWWKPVEGVTGYILQILEVPKTNWEEARTERYDAEQQKVTIGTCTRNP